MQALDQGQVFCSAQDLWVNTEQSSEPSCWGCGALWRRLSCGCSLFTLQSPHVVAFSKQGDVVRALCALHSLLPQLWDNAVRPPGLATRIFQEMQEMKFKLCHSSAESHVPTKHKAPMNDNDIIVQTAKIFLFANSFCGSFLCTVPCTSQWKILKRE